MPIISRKASASIRVVGCRPINPATGPDAKYMTITAITTATIIALTCSANADRRDDRINRKHPIDCRDLRDNQAVVPALWFAGKDGIYVVDDDGGA